MRLILAFVLLVALAAVVSANTGAEALPAADIARQFTAFISRFKKSYAASTFAAKLKTFTSNIARIAARSKDKLAKFGITKFADLSKTEFKRRLGARRPPASAAMVETEYEVSTNAEAELAAFTDAFDWSARGVFPGVPLDQGDCGSCWAFTTAAVLDAARGIKGLKGDYVSPQALVDCARSDLCGGCDGGHIYCAATFTRTTGFFALKDKPYRGVERTCSVAGLTPLGKTGALQTISHRRNATAMLNAIRKAPVFGTIMAETLQFYESGILTHSADCDAEPDHAVTFVGGGVYAATSQSYFVVRNSWGADWGMNGNFKIAPGACHIADDPFYTLSIADAAAPTPTPTPTPRR